MFRVIWLERALDQLTALWVQADTALRGGITAAVAQIDRELQTRADKAGESRSGRRRILFATPLGIFYEIDDDNQTVIVVKVWLFSRRS